MVSPHSIAIFRALQLGDLLCAVPSFTALRHAYPEAHITLIGLPWASEFVRRFPHLLDEHVSFPGATGLPEQSPDLVALPDFIEHMRSRRFDLALQMQGDGSVVNALVAQFGATRTVAFGVDPCIGEGRIETLPYPRASREVDRLLALTQYLGIPTPHPEATFPVSEHEKRIVTDLRHRIGVDGPYVCLHPGARSVNRRWPAERFAIVGDRLARAGFDVLITGTEDERPTTTAVARAMREPAHNLAGLTTLGTATALVRGASIVVCNDTGISHIAAATRTPSVVIFSASEPERWAPLDADLHRVVHGPRTGIEAFAPAMPLDVIRLAFELLNTGVRNAA